MYTSGGMEVVVFPGIAGLQWSDTVGNTLWEGGVRRCCPGFRPSSCSVPAVVMARDGSGPPGRGAGVHTRRPGGHVEVPGL